MVDVRIYRPAKSATQSGRGRTRQWVLEFEPKGGKDNDPMTGWVGSGDTTNQVRLRFPDQARAIAFAEEHGYSYELRQPHQPTPKVKSYADNFRFDAVE